MKDKIRNATYFNRYIADEFNPAEIRGILYGALMMIYENDTEKVKKHLIVTKENSKKYYL